MGGALRLGAAVEVGSTFELLVPLRLATSVPSEGGLSGRVSGCGVEGLRVLVAEDNAVNQLYMAKILEKFRCRAVVVEDGSKVLEILSRQDFDVVLMDCQMPVMDGFEATRKIRDPASAVRRPSIPIVALTANAFDEDRRKCLECGMDDYLAKPVQPEALLDALLRNTVSEFGGGSSAGEPPQAQSPPFEFDVLKKACGGDLEKVAKVLEEFLTALPVEIDRLQTVLRGDRWETGRLEAASLAKAARQVGANDLESALGRIGNALSRGRRSQALDEFESIPGLLEVFRKLASVNL
jgi:CheY-like chemotaxis protein